MYTFERIEKGMEFKMDKIVDFLKDIPKTNIISSLIIIVVSFFIYRVISRFIVKSEKRAIDNNKLNKKSKTYFRLLNSILKYIFIIIALLLLLQINGVNVSSMLAGVGIVSVIVGLAVQDALKDIIRGFSILSDDYFSVGDIVTYNDITGKVLVLGLKTTKIEDISTDDIISIANRNIEQIQIVSKSLYVNFPMPYELPIDKAEAVVAEIIDEIKEFNDVEDAVYKGVSELADSSIKYLIKITCSPEKKSQIRRDTLGCILRTLAKHNIDVPYNQIDVHQK